jgi:hypothetical protein
MVELEADDALASAAHLASGDEAVEKVCIWTPDKDLAQSVEDDRVVQVDRKAKKIFNAEGVRTKFGVLPGLIPDYLALIGDSADGYPGIPGIGHATADRLLNRYGKIEDFPDTVLGDQRALVLLFNSSHPSAPMRRSSNRSRAPLAGPTGIPRDGRTPGGSEVGGEVSGEEKAGTAVRRRKGRRERKTEARFPFSLLPSSTSVTHPNHPNHRHRVPVRGSRVAAITCDAPAAVHRVRGREVALRRSQLGQGLRHVLEAGEPPHVAADPKTHAAIPMTDSVGLGIVPQAEGAHAGRLSPD